jgi:hypothetical protein
MVSAMLPRHAMLCCAVLCDAVQWCDDNPDEPLSIELLGLLPAALENPTRVAVVLFVMTRVLRNIAAGGLPGLSV